jgi:hypothetical protein
VSRLTNSADVTPAGRGGPSGSKISPGWNLRPSSQGTSSCGVPLVGVGQVPLQQISGALFQSFAKRRPGLVRLEPPLPETECLRVVLLAVAPEREHPELALRPIDDVAELRQARRRENLAQQVRGDWRRRVEVLVGNRP